MKEKTNNQQSGSYFYTPGIPFGSSSPAIIASSASFELLDKMAKRYRMKINPNFYGKLVVENGNVSTHPLRPGDSIYDNFHHEDK